jgi:hypothetical protein
MRQDVLENDSSGTLKIKTTYQSAQMDSRTSGFGSKKVVTHYDSTKPDNKVGPGAQVLKAMIGQSVIITVSPRGEVLKIEGWDKLAQRIVDSYKIPAAERARMLKSMQASMKSQTGQATGLAALPELPVAIGDSWTSQNSQVTGVPILLSTRYTLTAVESDIATLSVQSKISANPNAAGIEFGDSKTKINLSGTQSGVMRVDVNTGLPQSFELHQRMAGSVSVSNAKMPKASLTIPMYMKLTIRGWTVTPPR